MRKKTYIQVNGQLQNLIKKSKTSILNGENLESKQIINVITT